MASSTPDDDPARPPTSGQAQRSAAAHAHRTSRVESIRRPTPPEKRSATVHLPANVNATATATANVTGKADANANAVPPRLLPSGIAASPRVFRFDPWNSASTGHQRAENKLSGSTSWRDSRTAKLKAQWEGGLGGGGGKRVSDSVGAGAGAGAAEFGGVGVSGRGQRSLKEVWGRRGKMEMEKRDADSNVDGNVDVYTTTETDSKPMPNSNSDTKSNLDTNSNSNSTSNSNSNFNPNFNSNSKPNMFNQEADEDGDGDEDEDNKSKNKDTRIQPPAKPIFRNLTFYINGSTMPLISDHKLKYLLHAHGGALSLSLGRRTVTHVILGRSCGGGLAGGKLQKEIAGGGKVVRYVGVEWVLESIKAGTRLGEGRFAPVRLAAAGQGSVTDGFVKMGASSSGV